MITRSPPSTLSSLAYVLVESSTRVVPSTTAIDSAVPVYVPAVRNSVSSKNIALPVSYISSWARVNETPSPPVSLTNPL